MQDINAQVLSVSGRTTRNGRTLYDVALSDGQKYTTFEPDVANKANALTGQQVTARVEVTQNGQYTNYNLKDIAPAGSAMPPLAMPVPAGAPLPVAGPSTTGVPTPIPMTSGGGGGMSPEREAKIVKQSSFSSAAVIVAGLFQGAGPEAVEQAKQVWFDLAKAEFDKVMGVTPPATAAEVAQVVNAELPGAVQVGAPEQPPAEGAAIPW